MTAHPYIFSAVLTTARMTAFNPGASPPPVRTPIVLLDRLTEPLCSIYLPVVGSELKCARASFDLLSLVIAILMKNQFSDFAAGVFHKCDFGIDHFEEILGLGFRVQLDLTLTGSLRHEAVPLSANGEHKIWRKLVTTSVRIINFRVDLYFSSGGDRRCRVISEGNSSEVIAYLARIWRAVISVAQHNNG